MTSSETIVMRVNHCALCNTVVEEYSFIVSNSSVVYQNHSDGFLHLKNEICQDCRNETKYSHKKFWWSECKFFVENYNHLIVFADYENRVDMLFSYYILKLISEEYQCKD